MKVARILLTFMFSLLGLWRTLKVNGWAFIAKKVSGLLNNVVIYFGLKFHLSRINKWVSRNLMSFIASLFGL